jgi:hypothetical protein
MKFAAALVFGITGAIVFALISDRIFLALRDAFGWDFGIGKLRPSVRSQAELGYELGPVLRGASRERSSGSRTIALPLAALISLSCKVQ